VGDLRNLETHRAAIASATRIIHTATAWGDPERAQQVNVVAVKQLLAAVDPRVLEQVVYFSTASILNRKLQVLPEAMAYDTEYIQTKAQCLEQLEQHSLAPRIVAVFPTLVFGGRVDGTGPFPTSYLTAGLREGARWLWLARWFRADASFHYIHAADIARVCVHLATTPHQENPERGQGLVRRLVLGQPAVTMNDTVRRLARWRRSWIPPFALDLQGWLIEWLIKFLGIDVNAWDRFSIRQRHFVHEPISPPERFGLVSHAASLEQILEDAGLPHRG
jgi:nucleoside-diphosphate-sugar epimerase